MGIIKGIKSLGKSVFNKVSSLGKTFYSKIGNVFSNKIISKVPPQDRDELLVAKYAYTPPDQRPSSVLGYDYDRSISDTRWAVYVNHDTKLINLGFRGTVPTNLRDLGSDIKILLTDTFQSPVNVFKKSIYMDEARKAYDTVKSKYPQYDITVVGHSLGAKVSFEIAREKNDNAVGFNPGGGGWSTNEIPKGSYGYRAPNDPISLGFGRDPKMITVIDKTKPEGLNHSLNYFI